MGTRAAIAFTALALSGCIAIGNSSVPIPTLTVASVSPDRDRTLIVVLPGFANDEEDLRDRGIDAAIHRAWPEADVMLTGATYAYYRSGKLVPRLHEEIIAPARANGYRRIVLAGGSMGGMGALLYETVHPGVVDALVLFSPFLGEGDLIGEIREAGGPGSWDPGVLGEMDGDNFERHVWKTIKGWTSDRRRVERVWLMCGTDDRLLEDVRVLAPVLPPSHYFEPEGGHTWDTWRRAAETIFARVRSALRE